MKEDLQEDWLETRLCEEAAYIDDAGFTAQVMQKLPAPRPSQSSLRGAILLGATILACIVAYFVSDGGHFLVSAVQSFAAMPLWLICTIAILCAALATGVSASVAYFQARPDSLG